MNAKFDYSDRKKMIYFFYKQFLLEQIEEKMIEDLHQNFSEYHFSEQEEKEVLKIINNFSELKLKIKKVLPSDWKWERINNLEKSILIYTAAEMIIFKQKKAIAIDNAIKYAKKYCDLKTYRLLNLILDKIEI
ncbi:/ / transcription antitermination protein NusB / 218662:219063 Forward [Candidatus Hepatoplasma crinochetorum]|uniref:/ / transcription antitermination protein NusB / 218662:219063 Forward n=1 Tax=Candidatus Hepatoplasma crinochetorum TaxID=295596 RepID=A0A0G7ZNL4_9MOLU|nr:/ / transcription antitermination protein NusB / 218662:219063 Forward [Candidatus Hepatoplasma crinochetorum]